MRVSGEGRGRVQVWMGRVKVWMGRVKVWMGRVRRGGEESGEVWCEHTVWLSV